MERRMTISQAVRLSIREDRRVAAGNTGLLYFAVCRYMGVTDPAQAPDPGTVYKSWRRNVAYARAVWESRDD